MAGLVVVFLAVAGYQFLLKSDGTASPRVSPVGIVTEDFSGGLADNQEFLRVLKNLESVSLDGSILTNEAFASLVDFSVQFPDQPKGRVNPFKSINPFDPELVSAGASAPTPPPAQ